jgi:hypothetical protein
VSKRRLVRRPSERNNLRGYAKHHSRITAGFLDFRQSRLFAALISAACFRRSEEHIRIPKRLPTGVFGGEIPWEGFSFFSLPCSRRASQDTRKTTPGHSAESTALRRPFPPPQRTASGPLRHPVSRESMRQAR